MPHGAVQERDKKAGLQRFPGARPFFSASIRPPRPRRGPHVWLHTDPSALGAAERGLTPWALQMLPFSKCADVNMGGKLCIRLK